MLKMLGELEKNTSFKISKLNFKKIDVVVVGPKVKTIQQTINR